MGKNKFVKLDVLADDSYMVRIGTEGCHVQQRLPSEAQALKFIVDHATPYTKVMYNSNRLRHVFNNALQHIWMEMEETGKTYSLHTLGGVIEQITGQTEQLQRLPRQLSLFPADVYKKRPLGACSSSYPVSLHSQYEDLKDDMEYLCPGITQAQSNVNLREEAITLDYLLEE